MYYVDQVVVADRWHNRLIYGADQKYDLLDASKLVHLLRGQFIHPVHHTHDPEREEFKNLVLTYHDVTKQLTRFKNKLKA
ncbi:MAG: hypothetical protein IIA61_09295 [Candidatus Marinimicrobia bacterium]|nr:hypothetical protein [Candidatus Neomarinimicrobiota bacterium]